MSTAEFGPAWLVKFLSARQRRAFELFRAGVNNRQIANQMGVPVATAAAHVEKAKALLLGLASAQRKGDQATLADFDVPWASDLEAVGLSKITDVEKLIAQNMLEKFLTQAALPKSTLSVLRAVQTYNSMKKQ